jgi:uncharacterized membrane protein YqjE
MPGAVPPEGLGGAVAQVGATVLALVRTRLELASVEFSEERERTQDRLVLLAVTIVGFAFALLAASAFVVVCFWDTYRIPALAGVTLFYAAIGAVAVLRLNAGRRTDPLPFAATLAELERDYEGLTRKIGGGE